MVERGNYSTLKCQNNFDQKKARHKAGKETNISDSSGSVGFFIRYY